MVKLNDIVECVITGFGDNWVYVKILSNQQNSVIYKSNMRFVKHDEDGNHIEVEDQFQIGDVITAVVDKVFNDKKCRLSVTKMLENPRSIFQALYSVGDTFSDSVVIAIGDVCTTVLADGQFKINILNDCSLNIGDKIDLIKVVSFDKGILAEIEGKK